MTCRYAHRRIATLFTAVQGTASARVIDWPQIQSEKRLRQAAAAGRPQRETPYANK